MCLLVSALLGRLEAGLAAAVRGGAFEDALDPVETMAEMGMREPVEAWDCLERVKTSE